MGNYTVSAVTKDERIKSYLSKYLFIQKKYKFENN